MRDERKREVTRDVTSWKSSLLLKYKGSNIKMETDVSSLEEVITAFENIHLRRFGFKYKEGDIILDCVINKGMVENVTDDISHVSRSIDEVLLETIKF